jgi:predicted nucleotide-binding protein (sugar kinase/HSP70/actin superfamily)
MQDNKKKAINIRMDTLTDIVERRRENRDSKLTDMEKSVWNYLSIGYKFAL